MESLSGTLWALGRSHRHGSSVVRSVSEPRRLHGRGKGRLHSGPPSRPPPASAPPVSALRLPSLQPVLQRVFQSLGSNFLRSLGLRKLINL